MATEPQYIDLDDDDDSDLARLADEVRATNAPRLLRRGGVVIATITPATPAVPTKRKPLRDMTEEEREQEFRSSFGALRGHKGLDQTLHEIDARRSVPMPTNLSTEATDHDPSR